MTARVLITRVPERAKELIQELSKHDVQGIAVPVARTIFRNDVPLPQLSDFSWVVFTSVNGVRALARELERQKQSLPASVHLGAVGSATAEEARKYFCAPDVVASTPGGDGLASELIPHLLEADSPTVLWPCAEKPERAFQQALSQVKVTVVPWVGYTTEPISPEELKATLSNKRLWDAVFFAAPSAVRSFANAWPLPWNFAVAVIGETTGAALRESGILTITISRSADIEDQCAAILAALVKTQNITIS